MRKENCVMGQDVCGADARLNTIAVLRKQASRFVSE